MRVRQKALQAALVGLVAVGAATLGACASCKGGGSREDLALLPKEANILVAVNVPRLRDTAMWRKLLDFRDQPARKKEYDRFVTECGLDPAKQIESLTLALPSQTAGNEEMGAVVRGQFDGQKIVACAKDRIGHDLKVTEYGGKKLYNDEASGRLFFTFLDNKTLLLGGAEWIKKMVDLSAGKGEGSVKDHPELMALVKKVKTGDAVWGAGLVPDALRQKLGDNPNLASARSLKDVWGSVDFATGLRVDLVADLGSEAEAKDLAQKLGEQLAEAKKNPRVMMLGLASTLETIKASSEGAAFRLTANMNQLQLDQTVERLEGLFRAGAAGGLPGLGGGGASPSTDDPPPAADDEPAEPTPPPSPPPGGGMQLRMPELPK